MQPGDNVSLISVSVDASGLYGIELNYRNQTIEVFASANGRFLSLQPLLDMNAARPPVRTYNASQPTLV